MQLVADEKGQFFRSHSDAIFSDANAELLFGGGTPSFVPDRFCTVFLYLNDVKEGGRTTWSSNHDVDPFFSEDLPGLAEKLGKTFPDLPPARSSDGLELTPKAGMAVVHFPCATLEYCCLADSLADHAGAAAIDPKFIVQQFIWAAPLLEVERIAKQHGADMETLKKTLYG